MGIQQKELLFCNTVSAAVSSAATALVGSTVNMGANRDFYDTARTSNAAKSGKLWLTILCETIFATSGSPVITIALTTKSAATVSSGGTNIVAISGISQTLAAGTYVYQGPVPAHAAVDIDQYLGITINAVSGKVSSGALTAFLSLDADLNV